MTSPTPAAAYRVMVIAFPQWFDQSLHAFHRVMDTLITVIPRCAVIRPGLACVGVRGPARFYGSEQQACQTVRTALNAFAPVRIGIADTLGAAMIGVRHTTLDAPVRILPTGNTAAQLAPLAIEALGDTELAQSLRRLGITTIGAFAHLDHTLVTERFGMVGRDRHRQARALDGATLQLFDPYEPDRDVTQRVAFEPPLASAEQVAFGCMQATERFVQQLSELNQVCTEISITCRSEDTEDTHIWRHPEWFQPRDIVDRVRWQLAHQTTMTSPISTVILAPHLTDAIGRHQPGLWGGNADGALQHRIARLQSRFSHTAVLKPQIVGGRLLSERQQCTPFGEASTTNRNVHEPWPGHLEIPLPPFVYEQPLPAQLHDADKQPVVITDRGLLQTSPQTLTTTALSATSITAYWGPWALFERWWEQRPLRYRLQVLTQAHDISQQAFLLLFSKQRWFIEGAYD